MTLDVTGQNVKIVRIATSIVTTATVGAGPNWLAVTPDSTTAYVANSGGYTVSKVNIAGHASTPIFAGHASFWVSYLSGWVYSSNYFDNTIRAIAA
jgi:DNA-binding beta-propeller fold protein YncE